MMFCPRSLSRNKKMPVLGFSILLALVLALPSLAADKIRVAFSAVSPSQGVLWVAEVGGLLTKNGFSAEIIYTRAAIETLVAGEVDLGQMTGSLMSSARLQGADPVMTAPFYELDRMIENDAGLSLAEIFDLEGEEYYRALEEKTLEKALKRKPGIIAAGGGLVMNSTALFMLKLNASIVWLQAAPEALLARVRASKDQSRLDAYPQASKQLKAILDRRTPYYAQADLAINTTHKSPEAIVDAIAHAFTQSRPKHNSTRVTVSR